MLICVDVTEMLNVNFISGIQRVVKEILTRWIESGVELQLLEYHFSEQSFELIDSDQFLRYYTLQDNEKCDMRSGKIMKITEFDSGMCFFDMDSVWMNFCKRSWLLPQLKNQGTKVVALIYDIIPVTDSQYCHEFTTFNFMEYIGAHLKYGDAIICNAQATIDSIQNLISNTEVKELNASVVPLGSDFKSNHTLQQTASETVTEITSRGRYILMVGTLEPRKNHKYILDAFETGLFEAGWNLIFAGRIGWNIQDFIDRIHANSFYGKQFFHIQNATDADIDYLYRNSYAVAFPSFNEGYGLPIIEAFDRDTLVFAADVPVLTEVGQEYCIYFDLRDPMDFVNKLKEISESDKKMNEYKKNMKLFQKTTWDESAVLMKNAVMMTYE